MQYTTIPSSGIISYNAEFSPFLDSLSWPVALLPPALYEMLAGSVSPENLDSAFLSLGFSEVRAVASGLDDLAESLEIEAKKIADGPLLFSACPEVRKIARLEYPEISRQFASSKPPADIVAEAARRSHPDATLFFISPCSSRAKALLAAAGQSGSRTPMVEFAVPLHTIFSALLDAIESVSGSYPSVSGYQPSDGHMGGTRGHTEFVPSSASIRSWFENFSATDHRHQAGSCIELVICRGGCGQGDWAPERKTFAQNSERRAVHADDGIASAIEMSDPSLV